MSLTLAEYAQAKQLPIEFLQKLGLRDDAYFDGTPMLVTPYRDEDGHEITARYRLSQNGSDNFRWPKDTKAKGLVYGLDARKHAAAAGWALLSEGESDPQSARLHGIPAFGIPGATMFDDELTSPCLESIERLYVVQEPGNAGEFFVATLRDSRLADRLTVVTLGEHKDVSALHLAVGGDRERFVAVIEAAKQAAVDDDIAAVLTGRARANLAANSDTRAVSDDRHGADTQTEKGERMLITRISDVDPRRVIWLEPDLVARAMLTGLVAPGGTVKGLYGIHLAVKIAERGERTLFLCSEDALDYIIRPRFDAAGCDGKLAFALSIRAATGARALRFPSDLSVLEAAIETVRPQLVIIDPVASYIDSGLDMAKNNQMREILQPLIALAAETNVAIVPVYHLGKERGRGAIGSVAFEDACRQVLTAARDDEDEDVRYLELTKSNIGRTGYGRKLRIVEVPLEIDEETVGVAKLVDEGRSNKSVHALLEKKGSPGPEPEKRELARAALVEALVAAGTEGTSADTTKKQIAQTTGVSPSTIWRAFVELKEEDLVVAVPIRDEHGSLREWRWVAKVALLVGRGDA